MIFPYTIKNIIINIFRNILGHELKKSRDKDEPVKTIRSE